MGEILYNMAKKPFQWVFGGIAFLFIPMTSIMFLLSSESYNEWKEDLKRFHLSFYE